MENTDNEINLEIEKIKNKLTKAEKDSEEMGWYGSTYLEALKRWYYKTL